MPSEERKMWEALQALYLATESCIVDDVRSKVKAVMHLQDLEIRKLNGALDIALQNITYAPLIATLNTFLNQTTSGEPQND